MMKEICVYNKKLRVRHITMQIRQMVEILIKNSQSDNKDYKFSDEIFILKMVRWEALALFMEAMSISAVAGIFRT